MNIQASLETEWGDGLYAFRLTMSGILELEQKCSAPIADIVSRVNEGRYWAGDIREAIRLGLVGGGTKPADAVKLVVRYVDERPLAESLPIARAILLAVIVGFAESPLVDAPETGREAEESPSPSTPPPSTTSAGVWDLDPTFWTEFRSGSGLPSWPGGMQTTTTRTRPRRQ